MVYCEMNATQLHAKINDEVNADIKYFIAQLSFIIEKYSKPNMTIFSSSFIDEYKKLLKLLNSTKELKRTKKPDFCMFREFYEKLRDLYNILSNKTVKAIPGSVMLDGKKYSDKEFLKMYEDLYNEYKLDDSEAISLKQLNRYLNPVGRMYDKRSRKIINYTICRVFAPLFIDKIDELSDLIDNEDYLKLFFFDSETQTQKIFITEEKMKEVKNELKNSLSDLIETYEEEDKFGKKLKQLFDRLIGLYNENVLINFATESFCRASEDTDSSAACSYEEDHDALISSCIVKFINWLPVCDNNSTEDFFYAVTDVIDVIREPLEKSLDRISLNNGDLFLSNKNTAPRIILIKALYNNDYFRNKFIGYYQTLN